MVRNQFFKIGGELLVQPRPPGSGGAARPPVFIWVDEPRKALPRGQCHRKAQTSASAKEMPFIRRS